MEIRWQPGHLVRARRELQLFLDQAQWVLEVCDARAPRASRDRFLAELVPPDRRMLVLSHADLAHPEATKRWVAYWRAQGEENVWVVRTDRPGSFLGLRRRLQPRRRAAPPGLDGVRLGPNMTVQRAVVVGMPNVGKSTLINALARARRAKAEARAGTTRGPQWIRVDDELEILDTPGVLAPVGIRGERAYLLAALGLVSDQSFPVWEVAVWLVRRLGLAGSQAGAAEEVLEGLGRRWGLVAKSGGIHAEQTALRLLQQFRRGRLGRITLEDPEELASPSGLS